MRVGISVSMRVWTTPDARVGAIVIPLFEKVHELFAALSEGRRPVATSPELPLLPALSVACRNASRPLED